MDHWNHIVNTALLGTSRKMPGTQDFQGSLQEPAQLILANQDSDKEEQFLQLTALTYGFHQSGAQPILAEVAPAPECKQEVRQYCSNTAISVLKQVLEIDSIPLLQSWLEYCAFHQLLIPPAMLPTLLDKAWKYKTLRTLTATAGGHRAEWLGLFNNDWNFSKVVETPTDKWQNGATAQRVEALKELRIADPVTALSWLQETWSKEGASVKTELLAAIEPTIQANDQEWLESLTNERSKQVKDGVLRLLKKLPSSTIHQKYWQIAAEAIQPRFLLGPTVALPHIDESIFQSGIDKLSNDKKISDETYILSQIIALVHPSNWETQLDKSPGEVISFFQKHKSLQAFVPSLIQATIWFQYQPWAKELMQQSQSLYIEIIPLLPEYQQQEVCEQFFEQQSEAIVKCAGGFKEEWNLALAKKILTFAATQPYVYNQTYMNNTIHLIPVSIADTLDDIQAPDNWQTGYWSNIKSHLHRLIQVKKQVLSLSSI
ncbi:hypothetical protein DVR12_03410 [Chitinophaga silvatica]|uniref:Uncharacterized protein n=1 Tax=Chitinophaga silvatica TaxID=2282649 RepID=A0A3E1YHK2_9BACT|nr:DUF5691 domain-containing protein [Chitinophaga silvatica]RFS26846.1 hypothetical protein DVR12_03410 [Chitinophaga silvatica]